MNLSNKDSRVCGASTVMSLVRSVLPNSKRQQVSNKSIDEMETIKELAHDTMKASTLCAGIIGSVEQIVLGKPLQIKQALVCILAGGHLLIEDVPGVGKTTLANALATALGLRLNRIQFTSDLMPADVVGGSIYNKDQQSFVFHPGPVFTQVLLADEINRASPKTQSALLEAMAEGQVSIDGVTHQLPHPFFVLATQNPSHQLGTFPLPESQVDRFLMSISMGYPDEIAEKRMLIKGSLQSNRQMQQAQCIVSLEEVMSLQSLVGRVHVSSSVADYAWRVVHASRTDGVFVDGLSPRAGMAWMRAAQAWALIESRHWVTPDDLQATFVQCTAHRLQKKSERQTSRTRACTCLRAWLEQTSVE